MIMGRPVPRISRWFALVDEKVCDQSGQLQLTVDNRICDSLHQGRRALENNVTISIHGFDLVVLDSALSSNAVRTEEQMNCDPTHIINHIIQVGVDPVRLNKVL